MEIVRISNINELLNYKTHNVWIENLMIGSFSLFHIGHREAISKMGSKTKENSLIILKNKNSHLESFDYFTFLKNANVQVIYIIEMIESNYQITANDFVKIIKKTFPNLKNVISGQDWRFGNNREGTGTTFSKQGINNKVIPFVENNFGEKISSSIIWKDLNDEKEFNLALTKLVARPYSRGVIVEANKQGRKLGFPTANINIKNSFVPPKGIYFTKVKIEGCEQLYDSITNVGYAPSISNNKILKHETHILNFDKNIYGRELTCFYYKRVNKEKKHKSKNDLIDFISEIKKEAIVFYGKQK